MLIVPANNISTQTAYEKAFPLLTAQPSAVATQKTLFLCCCLVKDGFHDRTLLSLGKYAPTLRFLLNHFNGRNVGISD
jgi:hypothetical protein